MKTRKLPQTTRATARKVAPPTVVVTVPRDGLTIDVSWATKHGDITICADHPLTITPVAENAVRIGRGR